jgi:DNA-binding response OmpR family regulator
MRTNRNVNSKILVIDDEEQNILFLETLLVEAGFTNVFSIQDSREAVTWFKNLQPDIVLLDLSMPYRTGIEVMGDLEAEFPHHSVPILVLTADATRTSKHLALSMGATDYLSKPLDTIEVLLRVNNLLEIRAGQVLLEDRVRDRTAALERTMNELSVAQQETLSAWQVKDRFLANMSHEIRTPITGMIGLCSLMAEQVDDVDMERNLRLVMWSGGVLTRFLDDVLTISEDDSGGISDSQNEIHLWELVQESIALHEPLITLKDLRIHVNEPTPGYRYFGVGRRFYGRP